MTGWISRFAAFFQKMKAVETEYTILRGGGRLELEGDVLNHIAEGWAALGGVAVCLQEPHTRDHAYFYQAMTRERYGPPTD